MPDLGQRLQEGFSQIGNTILQVGLAKQKLKQQREQFDLKKKVTKSQLELAQKKGAKLDDESALAESQTKFVEAWFDKKNKELDITENKAREAGDKLNTLGQGAAAATQEQGMFGGVEPDPTWLAEQATGVKFRRTDEPTSPEKYREDLQKAGRGQMSWDALKYKYGDKIQEIDQARLQFKRINARQGKQQGEQTEETNLIEPRAEGLGRIGRGAAYSEAIQSFMKTGDLTEEQSKAKTDQIIGQIQDLQRKGVKFEEIAGYLREAGMNPELFLKFYR